MDRISLAIIAAVVALAWGAWTLTGRAADIAVDSVEGRATPVAVSEETVRVTIQQGEGPGAIARKLERAGVIRSADHFQVLAGLMGLESQLAAGEVELSRGLPISVAIDRLRPAPTLPQFALTVPEGWRLEEVTALVEQKGIATADEFRAALQATDYDAPFLAGRPAGATLEGYLFPDTYFFFQNKTTARDIVQRMLSTFAQKFPAELQAQAQAQGLTLHQAVTIASIVEREAQVPEERPLIASVYLNRIKQGMPLQADPTTQYALANDPASVAQFGWWKRGLTLDDLKVNSPYNTYVVRDLPPGPIASPGEASLRAVAQPAQSNFLFFVAKNDGVGSHAFATTLEEHNRNVAQYQR